MLTQEKIILPVRYKYISACGEGSAGSVIKVYDAVTEEMRALKILQGVSRTESESFAQEFTTLSRLHHPNLVQVYDYGSLPGGSAYFTMDYVDGTDIEKTFASCSPKERVDKFSEICFPILRAIGYVHSAGKIHGDIKPSNILIQTDNEKTLDIRIVDFGIAALDKKNEGVSGTIEYIAPEILQGGHLGTLTDMYSLGILFYELLTGELPFGGTPDDILKGHLQALAPLVSSRNMHVSDAVSAVIEKMLVKEAHRRWQTIREIEQAFATILKPAETASSPKSNRDAHSWIPGRMYGRQDEWQRLLRARESSKRQAYAVQLRADAGMGKTRLLREFAVDAMIAGSSVYQVQLHEHDTAKSVAMLLRSQRKQLNGAKDEAEPFREQTFEDLCIFTAEWLLQEAAKGEAVIIIDGFDKPDSSVRAFFEEVALRIKDGKNICVVSGERNVKKDGGKYFDDEIELTGIASAAVEEMFREFFGSAPFTVPLAQRLCALTGGNAGIIIDTLHFLESKGDVVLGNAGWECRITPERLSLPSNVGAELLRSYAVSGVLTDPRARKLLSLVALRDGKADRDAVESLMELRSSDFNDCVGRLCATGILKEHANGQINYEISSPALRDAFIATITTDENLSLHRQWGNYLRANDFSEKKYAEHYYLAGDYAHSMIAMEKAGEIYCNEFSYRNAATCYSRAIESLRKNGGGGATLAELQLKLADTLGMAGDRAAEGEMLQEAVVTASGLSEKKILADAYLHEARYYNLTGDFERASVNADKGKTLAHEMGEPSLAARCEAVAATSFHRRGEIQEFLKRAQRSVEMFESVSLTEDAASVLLDMGFAHMLFLNEPALALNEFEQARTAFEKAGSNTGIARATGSTGLAYYWLGKYKESIRSLETAHEIFQRLHDTRGQANALTNLSRVYLTAAQYSAGIHAAQSATVLIKKVRDRFSEQKVMETLGAIYERLGNYERARDLLARSYTLAQEIGNRAAEASSLQLMGILLIHREQFDYALSQLQRAQEIADALNETDAGTATHLWYAELFLRQPMPDTRKALEHVVEAEKIAAAGGKKGRETAFLQLRTRIALMEGNLADARRFASESLRLANTLPNSDDALHNIWFYHFKVFERSGDYATAKQSLERAYSLLMESANEIEDGALRRSYLEQVIENRDIVEAYRRINQEPLNAIPATNELMLRRLYGVSRALNSVLDLDEVLNRLMDNAIEVLRAERGLIFLYDERDAKLRVAAARNVDKSTIEDASKISEGILNDVFRRGKPVVTLNAGSDERFRGRPSVINLRLTTVFCVPLVLREKIIGTVYVDSRSVPSGVEDNATMIEFLEAFANLAAVAIENARLHGQLREENIYLRKEIEERYAFENIIGDSPAMKRVYEVMRGAIRGDSPVLLEGESGTGKELIARAIHFNGKRKAKQFIAVDCGALPETLLDSELFGHKKGAFTGATEDKTGLFEEGNGGTVFLDEITNTTSVFQAKLLRVVQEGEIRRVGDTATRIVDVRIIAATNKLLHDEVKERRFREDLYYRLNVIPIRIPPLRERRDDIPYLVHYFIKRFAEQLQSPVQNVSEELMNVFVNAEWRGNVRELENTIHRMMVFANSEILSSKSLPSDYPYQEKYAPRSVPKKDYSPHFTLNQLLKEHISSVLRSTNGNKTEAAKVLGMKRTTLIQKMKKLKMM